MGLPAFPKSLNCGVCVVRNLGLIRRILSGIFIVLSELPTLCSQILSRLGGSGL